MPRTGALCTWNRPFGGTSLICWSLAPHAWRNGRSSYSVFRTASAYVCDMLYHHGMPYTCPIPYTNRITHYDVTAISDLRKSVAYWLVRWALRASSFSNNVVTVTQMTTPPQGLDIPTRRGSYTPRCCCTAVEPVSYTHLTLPTICSV